MGGKRTSTMAISRTHSPGAERTRAALRAPATPGAAQVPARRVPLPHPGGGPGGQGANRRPRTLDGRKVRAPTLRALPSRRPPEALHVPRLHRHLDHAFAELAAIPSSPDSILTSRKRCKRAASIIGASRGQTTRIGRRRGEKGRRSSTGCRSGSRRTSIWLKGRKVSRDRSAMAVSRSPTRSAAPRPPGRGAGCRHPNSQRSLARAPGSAPSGHAGPQRRLPDTGS
jgi:hypothetical protein